uniref:Uncharacterized protein n=1 Tax=Anguilla anguilla TaxID=7936 RepID=A0A0E9RF56_ANGAN
MFPTDFWPAFVPFTLVPVKPHLPNTFTSISCYCVQQTWGFTLNHHLKHE